MVDLTSSSIQKDVKPIYLLSKGHKPIYAIWELSTMIAKTVRRPDDLVTEGLIPSERQAEISAVVERFSLAITPTMANLIDSADPNDPIGRQFIPNRAELDISPDELGDPTDDHPLSPVKGLVHRYPDRVLLKPTHACPIYCRFCFRREQVGPGGKGLTEEELGIALKYVQDRPEIWEVVVSGGDPWLLAPRRISRLMNGLDSIPHVEVIRFHTRVPVVDPGRVNDEMLAALKSDKSVWVVIHTNHVRELTSAAIDACKKLRHAGIPLLSQSALLKGINDNVEALTALFRGLVAIGVKPYYLHHGDLAQGTAHFRTSIEVGQNLTKQLRGRVSGLCQPTYILDIPKAHGKVPIGYTYATTTDRSDRWQIEDNDGNKHEYPPIPNSD